MEIPACCPHCGELFCWEIDLNVEQELAWAAPHAPIFLFRCGACSGKVNITFAWGMEKGSSPRPLKLLGGPSPISPQPSIILVDQCPHGCGTKLGLILDPQDTWAKGQVCTDTPMILGGYRCPCCDGEGQLHLKPMIRQG